MLQRFLLRTCLISRRKRKVLSYDIAFQSEPRNFGYKFPKINQNIFIFFLILLNFRTKFRGSATKRDIRQALKTILCFCAFAAGLFLFIPSAFATSEASIFGTECNYLESYLSVYRNNDVDQMLKLQTFLKEQEGFDVKLSGVFDSSTIIAVRKFQTRYSEDILAPWGLVYPTGNVSVTTRHKINNLSCGIITSLSEIEKEIIRSYGVQNTEETTDVDVVDTTIHDITDNNVPNKDTSKETSSESKAEIIVPIITIDSLSEYLDTADAEVGSDELTNSTTSSGVLQNNLAKNGGIVGIPVEFISQFSLPILIALTALILTQLYFFWQVPIVRKLRWVTKRF